MAEVTEQIQTVSNIPEWARPYATQLFGRTFGDPRTGRGGLLDEPYRVFEGQRIAGFNPLQEQAFGDIAAMGVSPQIAQATGLAGLAGLRAGEAGRYSPLAGGQFYQAPELQQFGMGPAERVGAERFGAEAMREYMSPYMEGVVERQKRGAVEDYLRQLPGIGAASVRAGARGGTREALLESEARRGLSQRMGDIEALGLQSAYQQAAQQFGADRAAQMQAALANQAAGMTTGGQNLQAALQAQAQRLQSAGLGAQYGLAGAQLGEQSRQFGAGLGLQGLQQQLAAAGQLGQLGQQQYQQGLGIGQAQLGAGAQIQGVEQQQLANMYQDFINRQQYPYKQLEFASGILRGFQPTGQTSTLYQPPGSTLGQVVGAGVGLGGLFGALGSGVPTTGG